MSYGNQIIPAIAQEDLKAFLMMLTGVPDPTAFLDFVRDEFIKELREAGPQERPVALFLFSLPKPSFFTNSGISERDLELSLFIMRLMNDEIFSLLEHDHNDINKKIFHDYLCVQEAFFAKHTMFAINQAISYGFWHTAGAILEYVQRELPPSSFLNFLRNNKGEVLHRLSDNNGDFIRKIFLLCSRYNCKDILFLLLNSIAGSFDHTVLAHAIGHGYREYVAEILYQLKDSKELLTVINAKGADGSTSCMFAARCGADWFINMVFDRCYTQDFFLALINPHLRLGELFKAALLSGHQCIAASIVQKFLDLNMSSHLLKTQLQWLYQSAEIPIAQASLFEGRLLALYEEKRREDINNLFTEMGPYFSRCEMEPGILIWSP